MEAEEIDNKLLELQDLYSVGKIQLFELVNRCFLLGKQHVTSEKDKEIEQLDKSWARCNNLLGYAENELNEKHKELQQLKEENERLKGFADYYASVLDEVTGGNWRKSPDHVEQKLLEAINPQ